MKTKMKILATTVIFMLGVSACATNSKKFDVHYKLGMSFFNQGNMRQALAEFTRSYEIKPDNVDLNNIMGLTYYYLGKYEESIKFYKKAIELSNNRVRGEYYNNLCAVYIAAGMYKKAENACKKAIEDIFYPTPELAYTNLGITYYKQGNLSQAEKMLKKALSLARDLAMARNYLGLVYMDRGMYKESMENLKEAVKAAPRYAESHFNLARAYLKLKNKKKAVEHFEKVVEIAPGGDLEERAKKFLRILK